MQSPIRKTRRSFNDPGHAHFLTYSCYRRLPLLTRDRTRRWVIDAMLRVRETQDVAIWAYVIMPEHVHLLVWPRRPRYEMRRILAALKRPVSVAAREHLETTANQQWLQKLTVKYPDREVFRFWQPGGGYDSNIVRERTVQAVIDYIHRNPVRRGLVHHELDWEWSSARFWAGKTYVPIRMDPPIT